MHFYTHTTVFPHPTLGTSKIYKNLFLLIINYYILNLKCQILKFSLIFALIYIYRMADEASSSGDAPPTGFDLNRDFLKPMFCASIDVGGMLPPIPGAVLDPQTLIFGPSTSEASLQAMLTTSFRVRKLKSSALY